MNDLRNSIAILFFYVIAILGITNIQSFEESVINLDPLFFVLLAAVIMSELLFTGLLIKQGVRISLSFPLMIWAVIYMIIWIAYWRVDKILPLQVHIIQLILIEFAAGLTFNVGRQIDQIDKTLDGLSSGAYPNRALDIREAEGRIKDELTRSRRYHHPLSMLVMRLELLDPKTNKSLFEPLQMDMMERFAIAKTGQIISDLSRPTDIILRDRGGQFVVLCPETNPENLHILAERIHTAASDSLGANLLWGSASFPDEALTYDDLLQTAEQRIKSNTITSAIKDGNTAMEEKLNVPPTQ